MKTRRPFTATVPSELARFKRRIRKDTATGCWNWTGAVNPYGYARFSRYGSVHVYGHVWSYVHHKGPIPAHQQIDHLCRNRACVNPEHLEAVTAKVNTRRGRRANSEKTHCPQGHPYDEANTRIRSVGSRCCRACEKKRSRKWADKNRDYLRAYWREYDKKRRHGKAVSHHAP